MNRLYPLTLCAVATAALCIAVPAAADFGGGSSSSTTQSQPAQPVESQFALAERLVKAKRYAEAVIMLEQVAQAEPRNADAFNLLGFSYRKLGKLQRAYNNYLKALELDPRHLGASEYLGELYLEMNDLPRAEERLAWLTKLCPKGCEQQEDLAEAIAAFKKKPRS